MIISSLRELHFFMCNILGLILEKSIKKVAISPKLTLILEKYLQKS